MYRACDTKINIIKTIGYKKSVISTPPNVKTRLFSCVIANQAVGGTPKLIWGCGGVAG